MPTSVLIVDDDAAALDVLRTRLEFWGYQVVSAKGASEALAILDGPRPPRIAIVDWMMPGMSGIELCRAIRARGDEYVYVVMLTCRDQHDDLIVALGAGADDYLSKPCHTAELELRLRAGLRIVTLQNRLHELADHDPLTGCWNRRRLTRFLEEELARAHRHRGSIAAIMLDVDHFKRINDTYGHAAGDAVLCQLVDLFPANLRPYDRFGRIGGEEFVIALPACDGTGGTAAAHRYRRLVESHLFEIPGHRLRVTASLGIAASTPGQPLSASDILARADAALYLAKSQGRNRVSTAGEGSSKHVA